MAASKAKLAEDASPGKGRQKNSLRGYDLFSKEYCANTKMNRHFDSPGASKQFFLAAVRGGGEVPEAWKALNDFEKQAYKVHLGYAYIYRLYMPASCLGPEGTLLFVLGGALSPIRVFCKRLLKIKMWCSWCPLALLLLTFGH